MCIRSLEQIGKTIYEKVKPISLHQTGLIYPLMMIESPKPVRDTNKHAYYDENKIQRHYFHTIVEKLEFLRKKMFKKICRYR